MSISPPPTPSNGHHPTGLQKFAVVLFTITVPVLALDYWQNGGRVTLLGEIPVSALFLIACIGSAVSFGLFAERRHRWFAPIPGAIAGLGAFGLHVLYTQWLEKESMHSGESLMVTAIGAAPGILIFWAIARVGKSKKKISDNA